MYVGYCGFAVSVLDSQCLESCMLCRSSSAHSQCVLILSRIFLNDVEAISLLVRSVLNDGPWIPKLFNLGFVLLLLGGGGTI